MYLHRKISCHDPDTQETREIQFAVFIGVIRTHKTSPGKRSKSIKAIHKQEQNRNQAETNIRSGVKCYKDSVTNTDTNRIYIHRYTLGRSAVSSPRMQYRHCIEEEHSLPGHGRTDDGEFWDHRN